MSDKIDINKLLNEYITSARMYGECIKKGRFKESDKHFNSIEKTFFKIKYFKKQGLDKIAELLSSENESVRLWASSHLLNHPEYSSIQVLEGLKESPSILSLTAEVTLDRWRNGEINY